MLQEELKAMRHGNSPYGPNRATRRKWLFRIAKSRGAGITKSSMGEKKYISKGTVKALAELHSMFANITFNKKGERIGI